MTQLIITAVGPDRPGIVGDLTDYLARNGANLLDTRMVNLRGQFALMVLLEAPAEAATQMTRDLPTRGEAMGLKLTLSPQMPHVPTTLPGLRYKLKTYSVDQPGIVAKLTGLLRGHNVNIEELAAWQESAAMSGQALFLTEMRVTVPSDVPLRKLRAELDAVCNELNIDADLEPDEG
ncbi:MAG TPA: ACT domain-containing protein [Tepidisphaeraceae bacterium]|nr:ACT domain-containing protein [Tepidisphaeraceae bacterium]